MKARWLNSRELESVLLMVENVGVDQFGMDRKEARRVALSTVQDAKASFDKDVKGGSPDAGLVKG